LGGLGGVDRLDRAGVTRREREVLLLLGERLTNAEIAERLYVSVRTVESHVSSLLAKLGEPNRRALAATGALISAGPIGPVSRIPAPITTFVGRQSELDSLAAELDATRLLLLTGAGGCGKSRLAIELATTVQREYPGGVWYVELASLGEPEPLAHRVATGVGLGPVRGVPPAEAVADALRSRRGLLVLDNCEHLVEASASLATELLAACPELTILATSRRLFGIGESVWPVPPMSLPRGSSIDWNEASRSDAVALFVERAYRQRPGFVLNEANSDSIVRVCRRLDGIPLAIELAAGLVGVLSVQQIEDRLGDSLELLSGRGSRLPRHRTVRAAIDWSYNLLSADEQALLRRLAVFSGGFTLESAEAVGGRDALDGLARLSASSLVETVDVGESRRFRLLETVRLYSALRLEADDEAAAVRRSHRDWFLALAEQAGPELRGPDQGAWLGRLGVEHDNLVAALSWSWQNDEPDALLRLSLALSWYWWVRGYYGEGRRWLERAVEQSPEPNSALRAEALRMSGVLASFDGDHLAAVALFDEALALNHALGDRLGEAKVVNSLGMVAWERAEFAKAWELWSAGLAGFRQLDDARGTAVALNNLGLVAREQGRVPAARRLFEESLTIYRSLGDDQGCASDLANLGQSCFEVDDYEEARRLYDESLAIRSRIDHRHGISTTLALQGLLESRLGNHEAAIRLLTQSEEVARAIGDRQRQAYAICGRGEVEGSLGQLSRANELFERALAMFRALDQPLGIAQAALGAGGAALGGGRLGDAGLLVKESLGLYRRMQHRRGIAAAGQVLAKLAGAAGNRSSAARLLRDALQTFAELGVRSGAASCLDDCAQQLAEVGRVESAIAVWEAAAEERRRLGIPLSPYERDRLAPPRDAAARRLGPIAAKAAEARGRATSLVDAIRLAASELESAER
jgi:predicted ATPase/DNA-binding CsgD family transcriptional regulator